ncbi:MAG TPA: DUF2726 domain-containing protein [Bacilli bacterium]|nr:DUF2726 domain-containing protein [Bacilli bacterium]
MKYIFFVAIIVLIIIAIILKILTSKKNINSSEEKKYYYIKKKFLNNDELFFYKCFKKLDSKYIVLPQVSLESIIKKKYYNSKYTFHQELNRILDFCIFDQDFNILLAIEINGESHNTNNRKYRDYKVKKILNEANIELLTFNINYPNTEESIIKRTTDSLNKVSQFINHR